MVAQTSFNVEKIKANVDLRGIVERDLGKPSRHAGSYDQYCCPFHNETNPSFTVWATGWKCFACSESGDAFKYLEKRLNISFQEAAAYLSDIAGVAQIDTPLFKRNEPPKKLIEVAQPPSEKWRNCAYAVIDRSEEILWSDEGKERLDYLMNKRCLKEDTIRGASLGFVPGEKDKSTQWNGLKIPHGITIPWYSESMVWGVKVRRAEGCNPKYLSISTLDESKAAIGNANQMKALYLESLILPGKPILICEGEFDCLVATQEAYDLISTVTVGSAGYAVDPRWYPRLALSPLILVCYDNDESGQKGAEKLGQLTSRAKFIKVPEPYKDISEFFADTRKNDPHALHEWIKDSIGKD